MRDTAVMKVIYRGQLRCVASNDHDGLILVSMGEPEIQTYAVYSSEGLIIDPTDAEVAAVLDSPDEADPNPQIRRDHTWTPRPRRPSSAVDLRATRLAMQEIVPQGVSISS